MTRVTNIHIPWIIEIAYSKINSDCLNTFWVFLFFFNPTFLFQFCSIRNGWIQFLSAVFYMSKQNILFGKSFSCNSWKNGVRKFQILLSDLLHSRKLLAFDSYFKEKFFFLVFQPYLCKFMNASFFLCKLSCN